VRVPDPPPVDVAAIRSFCEQRVPPHALDQVRLEAIVEGNAVAIAERRAPWHGDTSADWTTQPVARLRYVQEHQHWTLFSRDRDEQWHRYDGVAPTHDVTVLLDEVDRDPTAIFWG
jgi:Protein of unknown function (DUF3024)